MAQTRKPRPKAPKGAIRGGVKQGVAAKRGVKKLTPTKKATHVYGIADAAAHMVAAAPGIVGAPRAIRERAPHVVKVHEAKTNLSKLLQRVLRGGRVQIAIGNQAPSFEVVTINTVPPTRGTPRQFGSLRGVVTVDERFFEPLPADELEAWGQ